MSAIATILDQSQRAYTVRPVQVAVNTVDRIPHAHRILQCSLSPSTFVVALTVVSDLGTFWKTRTYRDGITFLSTRRVSSEFDYPKILSNLTVLFSDSNALTFTFLSDGCVQKWRRTNGVQCLVGFSLCTTARSRVSMVPVIPCVLHVLLHLSAYTTKYNRESLWPSNYTNTPSYQLISTLNQVF